MATIIKVRISKSLACSAAFAENRKFSFFLCLSFSRPYVYLFLNRKQDKISEGQNSSALDFLTEKPVLIAVYLCRKLRTRGKQKKEVAI